VVRKEPRVESVTRCKRVSDRGPSRFVHKSKESQNMMTETEECECEREQYQMIAKSKEVL
jgi:hypothetical protein